MHDTVAGRHDAQVLKLHHRPFHHAVAFLIPLELGREIPRGRARRTGKIDTHGVIDHEIGENDGIDPAWNEITRHHLIAHGGEVDEQRQAGGIRHQHAHRVERQLPPDGRGIGPTGKRLNIRAGDRDAILVTEKVFQQNLQRNGHPRKLMRDFVRERRKAAKPGAHFALAQRVEAVGHRRSRERFRSLRRSLEMPGPTSNAGVRRAMHADQDPANHAKFAISAANTANIYCR